MATRIQIGFDLSANGVGNYFTLDDATKGVLDNATYVLGGTVLVDVTSKVRSVQVKRGRSRQLDKFVAGNANLVLDNRDRAFDPLNTASPYFGNIIPGKQLVIDRDGYPIYTGNMADWNFGYDTGGDSTAEPSAVDGFAVIAQQTRTPGTATAEKTGTRIGKVLTEAGWPLTQRRLSVGQATLDADYVGDNVNSLGYIQTVGDISEPGAVFIGKDGAFVFRDRADLQAFTSGVTFGTSGIPMQAVEVVYGIEELWNSVHVTYSAGTVAAAGTANADDLTSQGKYGIIDQTYNTLLANATDAQALANWQLNQYSEPNYRFNTVTVNMLRLSTAQVAQVLALELGDTVNVTWTPNNIGSAISQYVTIDAIEHAISPADHQITFTLSQTIAAFILDDATFGVLDSNALGF